MMVHCKRPRQAPASSNRRGQSLILMFVILLALLGVMALTLDFGFVLLARRQMQTGVNSAALEGLRGQGLDDVEYSEANRRESARKLLRLNFDDDLDLSGNNTTIGAGIDSSLIQRDMSQPADTELNAYTIGPANTTLAQDLENRSSFIFRPDNFELNEGNETHGDMVVGTYDPADGEHAESPDYSRTDFDPMAAEPSSFLVRMRRTHNPSLPDHPDGLDEVPGVSSRGGGLPLLLGRAGWMEAKPPGADYSVRRDGVLVRATAITNMVLARAVSPGTPQSLYPDFPDFPHMNGVAPFAISAACWPIATETVVIDANGKGECNGLPDPANVRLTGVTSLDSDDGASITVSSTNGFPVTDLPFRIRVNDELLDVTMVSGASMNSWTVVRGVASTVQAPHSEDAVVVLHTGRAIGQNIQPLESLRPTDLSQFTNRDFHQYVPIFEATAEISGDRIIGFGFISWSWNNQENELTIARQAASIVAPLGVTGTVPRSITSELTNVEIELLVSCNDALVAPTVLTPALVRTIR